MSDPLFEPMREPDGNALREVLHVSMRSVAQCDPQRYIMHRLGAMYAETFLAEDRYNTREEKP